jgi:hypothetical protein
MTTVANTTGAVTKTTAETVAVAEKAIPITAVTQVGKQAPTEALGVIATTVIDPVASRADDASGSLAASRGNGTEAAGPAPEAANVAVTGVAQTASSAGAPRMSNRPRSGRTNAPVLNATPSFLSSGAAAAEVARTPGIQTRGSGPLPRPHHTGFFGVLAAFGEAPGGGGLLLFGLLGFLFLLVIPNAVRWLRPALALGLSPAYVATRDRPG